jgi:hypothetical protein
MSRNMAVTAQSIKEQVYTRFLSAPSESEERYQWWQVHRNLSTLDDHNLEAHRYLLQERLAHVSGVSRQVVEQALALFGEEELEA